MQFKLSYKTMSNTVILIVGWLKNNVFIHLLSFDLHLCKQETEMWPQTCHQRFVFKVSAFIFTPFFFNTRRAHLMAGIVPVKIPWCTNLDPSWIRGWSDKQSYNYYVTHRATRPRRRRTSIFSVISVRNYVRHDIQWAAAAVTLWKGPKAQISAIARMFSSYLRLSLNTLLRPRTIDLEQRLKLSTRLSDVELHLLSVTIRGQYLSIPSALSLTSL